MNEIIDQAYELYMPQDRLEITQLANFVHNHYESRPNLDPYNILEIGTKFGGTFYIWASINKSRGLNISIDMNDGGQHGGISDSDMDKRDLWFQERFDNVYFIRGNSHTGKTMNTVIGIAFNNDSSIMKGKLFPNKFIDFLFIDGDHTYEGVKQDFKMYIPFVKKGGIIAFHDINDSERHRSRNVYVSKFWQELVDSGKYETVEFNSNLDWAGIGVIIQK